MSDKKINLQRLLKKVGEVLPPESVRQQIRATKELLAPLDGQAVQSPQPENQPIESHQEHPTVPAPIINPKAKPPEQREAIIQEIQHREWNPLDIPDGGVKELKYWFIENFGKSESTFRDRWKELSKVGNVYAARNRMKKSTTK